MQLSVELLLHDCALRFFPGYTKRLQLCANKYPLHTWEEKCEVQPYVKHIGSKSWLVSTAVLICIVLMYVALDRVKGN